MNLKFENIVRILRKIIQLNAVIFLKSTNEYFRKIISKSGCKMDLYPALWISDTISPSGQHLIQGVNYPGW